MNENESNLNEIEQKEYQPAGSWNFFKAIILLSIVGFAAIVILQKNNSPTDKFLTPARDGDNLVLQLPNLGVKATFYQYEVDNVEIRFFAVLGTDDRPHIAFDACDVCYSEKLGYEQDGYLMVCRNCGNTFLIDGIGTENLQGGCWPSFLPVTVGNLEIYIQISDLALGKYLFV